MLHPLTNSPLKSLLQLIIMHQILPKLLVEPHPIWHPNPTGLYTRQPAHSRLYPTSLATGTPRKATWKDLEIIQPTLPLVWNGSTHTTAKRPFITLHGQKLSPTLLLYAWAIPLDSYLEDTLLKKRYSYVELTMVNPFLYDAAPKKLAHKLGLFRQLTPYDPIEHRDEMVDGIPLSIIYDDIIGVFDEEDWDYPSEEFWNGLANYPHEGVERVLLFFRNSDVYCERIAVHLRHPSNSEFRNLILPS